jgi:hypothetical protein
MKIAIVGAHCTGKTWLANALKTAIENAAKNAAESPHNISIHDAPGLNTAADFDLILLMGLDLLPGSINRFNAENRETEDGKIRAYLHQHGLVFKVVYGNPAARLATALRSLHSIFAKNFVASPACPEPIVATISSKTGQKWAWACDKCSDPECERRLFTALFKT